MVLNGLPPPERVCWLGTMRPLTWTFTTCPVTPTSTPSPAASASLKYTESLGLEWAIVAGAERSLPYVTEPAWAVGAPARRPTTAIGRKAANGSTGRTYRLRSDAAGQRC